MMYLQCVVAAVVLPEGFAELRQPVNQDSSC